MEGFTHIAWVQPPICAPTGALQCSGASTSAASTNTWTREELSPVLDDAANRLATNLGSGLPSLEFQTAMHALASAWTRDDDARCRAFNAAHTAFARLPADAATAADRDALQMTLDLAGTTLGATQR